MPPLHTRMKCTTTPLDVQCTSSTFIHLGVYLGFVDHSSHREWVEEMTSETLTSIEAFTLCALSLAKALFETLFKEELSSRPHSICTTSNRLERRELLNPRLLRAIIRKYINFVVVLNWIQSHIDARHGVLNNIQYFLQFMWPSSMCGRFNGPKKNH